MATQTDPAVDPRQVRIDELVAELPHHEVEFAYAYVANGYNGRKAVDSVKHYRSTTANSACNQASIILRSSKVKELIGLVAEQGFVDARISTTRILEELARLAFFAIRNYFDEDGRMKQVSELTDDEAAAIVGIEEIINGYEGKGEERRALTTTKYKLANKERCLELLGKYHKIFSDMLVDVKIDLASEIVKARQRSRPSSEECDA